MKHVTSWHLFEAENDTRELTPEQVEWLDKCTKGTWQVNPQTGLVDVEGDFDCTHNLTDFNGVQFGVVGGDFGCSWNSLTSLKGAPQKVGGDFNCHNNQLTSLKGAPQEVGGYFWCHNNQLTSLEGAPQEVGGDFGCDAFETKDWSKKGWLEIMKEGGDGAELILTLLPEKELDKWFKESPLDMDLLDELPEIKAGVLKRTGMRDISAVARQMRKGII